MVELLLFGWFVKTRTTAKGISCLVQQPIGYFFSTLLQHVLYFREMISNRIILITLFGLAFCACRKNAALPIGTVEKVFEGTVFEDCNGNVSKGKKIYLEYISSGCFSTDVISTDSTLTDNYGHFIIHYYELPKEQNSTTSYYHKLSIPNSTISLGNPNGKFDLYPNQTKMNAVIKLNFVNKYTATDTFYYQFRPTSTGFVQEPEQTGFLVGPFQDTTLLLYNLTVGNVHNNNNSGACSGFIKWGIGKDRLNTYGTGQDGEFYLMHQPCTIADTFKFSVIPI